MPGISEITSGQDLGTAHFRLDSAVVGEYLAAVEERSALYQETDLVPPTAVAALGVRAILEQLAIPSGTLHLSQELSMHRAVTSGHEVTCRAHVAQSGQRQGWQFVVVEFSVSDGGGRAVLDGRTTLLVPQQSQ